MGRSKAYPPLAFIDIETTGSHFERDRITEIAVKTLHDDHVEVWESLINPQVFIPSNIQQLTGITPQMVQAQPEFSDLAKEIHSQLEVSCDQALASMYAQYESGTLINGVEVFLQAYKRANLPVLVWLLSRSYLRPLLNLMYQGFARFRHPISSTIGPIALWLATSARSK